MNNSHQLYLLLKNSEEEDRINQLLVKHGLSLERRSGSQPNQFRNYFYHIASAPAQLQVSFKILPNKTASKTIVAQIFFGATTDTQKKLFDILKTLNDDLPFQLLDLKLRNTFYSQLHKEGKVDAYYIGLNQEEQDTIEQKSIIPIDFDQFSNNSPSSNLA